MSKHLCMKCDGEMIEGFVVQQGQNLTAIERWHGGLRARSIWAEIKQRASPGIPITTFRCETCGYVEQYADHKYAPD